mmetsp:Transcript_23937/g.55846  ORF Transcript_23937/g.55846 Transcript_23937/m.55846 type:complete len:212 (+) Transcript_23937:555-1190(+)
MVYLSPCCCQQFVVPNLSVSFSSSAPQYHPISFPRNYGSPMTICQSFSSAWNLFRQFFLTFVPSSSCDDYARHHHRLLLLLLQYRIDFLRSLYQNWNEIHHSWVPSLGYWWHENDCCPKCHRHSPRLLLLWPIDNSNVVCHLVHFFLLFSFLIWNAFSISISQVPIPPSSAPTLIGVPRYPITFVHIPTDVSRFRILHCFQPVHQMENSNS